MTAIDLRDDLSTVIAKITSTRVQHMIVKYIDETGDAPTSEELGRMINNEANIVNERMKQFFIALATVEADARTD